MKAKSHTPRKKSLDLTDDEGQMKLKFQKSTAHNKTKENQSRRKQSLLHLNLTILQWLGLWPCGEDSTHFKALFLHIAFYFVIIFQASIIISEIMDIVVNWGHHSNLTDNIYIMGCSITAIVKELTIIFRTKDIQHLVNILDNELATPRQQGSSHYKEIVRASTKQARTFTLVSISMGTFIGISYSSVPLIDTFLAHSSNNTSSHKPMPCTAWFPFDVTETPLYELAYCYLALEVTLLGVYIVCCDALFVSLIIYLCGQFQTLQASLRDMKTDALRNIQARDKERIQVNNINISITTISQPAISDTEESVHIDITKAETLCDSSNISVTEEDLNTEWQYLLKQCIKHHQILLEFLQELEYICSPFMVTQLLSSLVLICFVGFSTATVGSHNRKKVPITFTSIQLSTCISVAPTGQTSMKFDIGDFYENLLRNFRFGYDPAKVSGTLHEQVPIQSIKLVSPLLDVAAAILELFFFCWYSEELSVQNGNVCQAAYDCEWYEAPQSFKTSIQLIMKQAQKARTLKAASFCSLSLQTFTVIMRVSYSNYTLLRQLYDKN